MQQDVVQLDVAVGNAHAVAVVHRHHDLLEEQPRDVPQAEPGPTLRQPPVCHEPSKASQYISCCTTAGRCGDAASGAWLARRPRSQQHSRTSHAPMAETGRIPSPMVRTHGQDMCTILTMDHPQPPPPWWGTALETCAHHPYIVCTKLPYSCISGTHKGRHAAPGWQRRTPGTQEEQGARPVLQLLGS